ncbi:MAG: hypothetical protein QNJ56_02720 [Gammaproteobacteria bacterium]|nr:hypothetical protein [Gammaproteobacteria bacterium]
MTKSPSIVLLLLSPATLWAHAGHSGPFNLSSMAHFQLYEAMLVASLLLFFVLSRHIDAALKKIKSRFKRVQSRHK